MKNEERKGISIHGTVSYLQNQLYRIQICLPLIDIHVTCDVHIRQKLVKDHTDLKTLKQRNFIFWCDPDVRGPAVIFQIIN